jgi:viroplasmin and RNaseH domain-containing protein
MAKFYAVKEGKKPGIYMSWDECKEQVNGYSGAVYKSFTSEDEAKAFIGKEVKKVSDDLTLLAYVDGSYNIKTKEYGYGCVLIEGQQVIQQLLGKGNIPEYSSMRNVSGEILGCMKAIAYAIDHHYESICIYYDYEGIEKWATGLWKANKEQTQNYVKTINDMKKKIDI